jgi:hypothetical protein
MLRMGRRRNCNTFGVRFTNYLAQIQLELKQTEFSVHQQQQIAERLNQFESIKEL